MIVPRLFLEKKNNYFILSDRGTVKKLCNYYWIERSSFEILVDMLNEHGFFYDEKGGLFFTYYYPFLEKVLKIKSEQFENIVEEIIDKIKHTK